jgi:ribosomal protein L29
MAMFDVNSLEAEVQKELAEERAEAAKGLLKAKLAQIAKAKKVVQTLEMEYKELLTDIALEG